MKNDISCAIAYNVHDSSVSFAVGNKAVLVLEAERVFREKKKRCNQEEMEYLIGYGLSYLGKKPENVSHWAMATHSNPLLAREDIVDPRINKPRPPYWKEVEIMGAKRKVFIVNHHLSHAATYLFSPFKQALIISCDGGCDAGECFAVYKGNGNTIERQEIALKGIVTGKTYANCTAFIYNAKSCEGKLMGLAAFGEIRQDYLNRFEKIYHALETVDYNIGEKIVEQAFPNLKGSASVLNPNKDAKDFCATLQRFFVEHRLDDIRKVVEQLYKDGDNLVIAGGTALNLELNTSLLNWFPKMQQFIAPCCDDTGQSLGALCILIKEVFGMRPVVNLPYLGIGNPVVMYNNNVLNKIIDVLLKDGIAILHNGKAEIGPRALGNRSLIARPDNIEVKKKLSEKIKQRAKYRPIAPAVIEERAKDYFAGPSISPFMSYRYEVLDSKINEIIGGVHYDNTARIQTVNKNINPFFYDLIKQFGELTGIYVLLNTSLNLGGDPIANNINDSLRVYNKIKGPKIFVYNGQVYATTEK